MHVFSFRFVKLVALGAFGLQILNFGSAGRATATDPTRESEAGDATGTVMTGATRSSRHSRPGSHPKGRRRRGGHHNGGSHVTSRVTLYARPGPQRLSLAR